MRRLLPVLLVLPALPPATAHAAGSTHAGGCHPDNVQTEVTSSHQVNLTAAVVLYSPDATANPVSATVTCSIRVNGVDAATASGSGTGVVAFRRTGTFTASETDVVELCTRVEYVDGTPTSERCARWQQTQVPPQVVYDTFDTALDQVWAAVDPVYCPILAEQAPGIGPVRIDDQGDVYVADEPVWDCPPYDVVWP